MAPGERPCPFCERLAAGELVAANERAAAFADAFPVSPGHTLLVPRRHVRSYFELDPREQGDLWGLLPEVRRLVEETHSPAGYNVGLNDGAAAGQTVWHAHLHLIPRYAGDVDDPRGGVRFVIRGRAPWWKERG